MNETQPIDLPSAVPVTVLSGFLGSGKTTLLNRLLSASGGRRIACIVNDLGEVNVDAELVRRGAMSRVDAHLIQMQNGCICCTLRGDLLDEVARLAREGFDHIVIESTGIGEPMAIAETFVFELEDGSTLADIAAIDAMITLVDATTFLREWRAPRAAVAELVAVLGALNPRATIVEAVRGDVPLELVLDTGRFDFDAARAAPGWLASLSGAKLPETVEYGIGSFVYRARRPFHPERFWAWLGAAGRWDHVLRSKGFFWLASRPELVGLWQQAGGAASCEPAGTWWASAPRASWPDDEEVRAEIERQWVEPWGDRRQELVFIGQRLDVARINASLDACLLSSDELAAGDAVWRAWPDPFPPWSPPDAADAPTADAPPSAGAAA